MPTLTIRTFMSLKNQTSTELLDGHSLNVIHGHHVSKQFDTQEEVDEIVAAIKKFQSARDGIPFTDIGDIIDLEQPVK